jgi:superfamily II DNA or RNA helicase
MALMCLNWPGNVVKLIVSSVYTQIEGLTQLEIIDAISDLLSYSEPGYKFQLQYKTGGWDGKNRLLTRTLKFPSGLVEKVHTALRGFGIEVEIVNNIRYEERLKPAPYLGPKLYPHQIRITDMALDKKRGMIKSPTGSGKTYAIANIVGQLNLPTMVYVVSLELLNQMHETIADATGLDVGIIGGGKCEIRKINVCSVWTAGTACGQAIKALDEEDVERWTPNEKQKRDILDAIHSSKVIILDEAQFAAAQSIRLILRESKDASYRLGFTATPWRTSGDDILLEAAFGPRICDITASELIEKGYLAQPKIIFRDIPKYESFIEKQWRDVKKKYINDNDVRDGMLVSNTLKLLEMGRRPLMLYREISHGERLIEKMPADIRVRLVNGRMRASEREKIRDDYRAGLIDILVASTIYDQGVDIKELDALIPCAGGKSTAKALQRVGRVIRTNPESNKRDAFIIETFDQTHFMKDHSVLRYDIYKSEPAFAVKTGPDMHKYLSKKGKL